MNSVNIHFKSAVSLQCCTCIKGSMKLNFKTKKIDNRGEAGAEEELPQGCEVIAQYKHNGSVQGTLDDRHGRHSSKYTYVQNRDMFTAQKQFTITWFSPSVWSSTFQLVFLYFKHANNAVVFLIPIKVRQDKITVMPKSLTRNKTDRRYSQLITALTRYKTLQRQELTCQFTRGSVLGTEILVLSHHSVTYIIKQLHHN